MNGFSEEEEEEEEDEFVSTRVHGAAGDAERSDDSSVVDQGDVEMKHHGSARGKVSKEERIFGTFRTSYDDVEKEKTEMRPIVFVSSSAPTLTSEDIESAGNAMAEKVKRESEFETLVGASERGSRSKSIKRKRSGSTEGGLDKNKLQDYSRYGKKGFALKFMHKFNFQGRLGKEESGISEPIAVKARPERLGLGGGGFQEATQLEQNRKIHAEQFGETESEARRRKRKELEAQEKLELQELWQQVKKTTGKQPLHDKRKKMKYRTVADLRKSDGGNDDDDDFVLFDMRGNSAKISRPNEHEYESEASSSSPSSSCSSSSSSSSSTSQGGSLGLDVVIGKELVHNIQILRDAAETIITRASFEEERISRAVSSQKTAIQDLEKEGEEEVDRLSQIQKTFSTFEASLKTSQDSEVEIQQASEAALRILSTHWDEFSLGEDGKAFAFNEDLVAYRIAENIFGRWKYGGFVSGSFEYKSELQRGVAIVESWISFLQERCGIDQTSILTLAQKTVLHEVEVEILRAWQFCNEHQDKLMEADAFALDSLDAFRKCIALRILSAIAEHALLPELSRRVDEWSPSSGNKQERLDFLVIPWIGFLKAQIRSKLHRKIRQKITNQLKTISDLETAGPEILRPWRSVLSEGTYDRLINEGILPQILRNLRFCDCSAEAIPFVDFAMSFISVMRREYVQALFLGEFFQKWLRYLESMLVDVEKKNLKNGNIVRWYSSWRTALAPILSDKALKAQLGRALGLIAFHIHDGPKGCLRSKSHRSVETVDRSFETVLDKLDFERSKQQRLRKALGTTSKTSKGMKDRQNATAEMISTREFLDWYAQQIGTTFMRDPKLRNTVEEAKPIFVFEDKWLTIENDICYRVDKNTNRLLRPFCMAELSKTGR